MVPLCYNCVLNYGLGVVRPEMAMYFGSIKWNRCLVRGLSHYSFWGLLKTVPVYLIGPKMSMCFCILLLKNEWLKIWLEMNC